MTSTGYLADEIPAGQARPRYVRRDDAWLEEPMDGYGALASMGGVFTSVARPRPLGRRLHRCIPAARRAGRGPSAQPSDPARDAAGQRSVDPSSTRRRPSATPILLERRLRLRPVRHRRHAARPGRRHGGGYPGFGSNMRWHPASGLGVVAFANARYAQVGRRHGGARGARRGSLERGASRRPVAPRPRRAAAVERLLGRWDDDEAAALFAMNVELDEPLARRRATIERIRRPTGR